ncbi:dolichol-phosphate mannosyltransferase [Skermanella stibiiresistens SB22]|uniref:Dolichol-phosphate mannosyltransferase n=1 Tax=Skermanella stibiiresistens SB22 TaxID=1385369 RepID=W9H369_9PROT|nr:glycosyltransferase family 2 protein [Skermanella stibiiresistens]EWY40620.1 dolichol-phosphate mannosyltransferase [Skermanella stibiiresistens SB22]
MVTTIEPLVATVVPPPFPASSAPRLSVVIPVHNEADNVLPLLSEIRTALTGIRDHEVIFVDDGSDDGTAARLEPDRVATANGGPGVVRVIRHGHRTGQSAAVRTGVRAARGTWIATLDGDGQNDPADIPSLLARALEPDAPALIGGLRRERRDIWSKRAATRIANGLRQAVLRDGCVDTGCGIKVFRRDAFLGLPFFGAMHRFLPALFQIHGHRVEFVEVNHRPRRRGVSKYGNLGRAAIGIVDLIGVLWLKRRTHLPDAIIEDGPYGPAI